MSEKRPKLILSLGAGIQSTTLALMAKDGEIEMPEAAIFADTGAEPKAVYEHLDWLESVLPYPVHRVQKDKGLLENVKGSLNTPFHGGAPPFYTKDKPQLRAANPPFYAESEGRPGMLRRQCTREFKIEPITIKIRELIGAKKGQRLAGKGILVRQFIGISLDEAIRMKPSRDKWVVHEWPLIDKRMTRHDCKRWLKKHGYPIPPKSACSFCPYRSNHEWRDLRDNQPEAWAEALEIDRMIRSGVRGTTQRLYLHQSCKPLDEADLRTDADIGQQSLWGNECEGMCGL